jgi:hypothetical protein
MMPANKTDDDNLKGLPIAAQAAVVYTRAGFSVVRTGRDKMPTVKGWKFRQRVIPNEKVTIDEFSQNGACVAIVAGKVSGNLECIDFDCGAVNHDSWCGLVQKDAPGLIEKLVLQQTPSGGCHVIYRCRGGAIPGNQKLAFKKIEVEGSGEHEYQGKKYPAISHNGSHYIKPITIETRGEGGYFLTAPSPGYTVQSPPRLTQVQRITPEERQILINAARALNQWIPEPEQTKPTRETTPGDLSPGDDYNQRGEVKSLLKEHGWQDTGRKTADGDGERLRRPGKNKGQSATLFDSGTFYVFSTNAPPFDSDSSYSPFAVYSILEHSGDYSAAAKELYRQGYGNRTEKTTPEQPAEPLPEPPPPDPPAEYQNGVTTGSPPPIRFEITTLENIHIEKIEERPIIKGLLYEEEPTIIFGDGGVGKSLITEDISMALGANMKRLWDLFIIAEYRVSLFVQSENGRLSVHQRTNLKCQGNPEYIKGLQNIVYAGQYGSIQVAGHVTNTDFQTSLVNFARRVEQHLESKIGVIFWDPLISFHEAEENDNSRMRTTLDLIQIISNKIGATPIVVHHANKESGLRGATAIQNWARNIIELKDASYRGQKRIKVTHKKCNNHALFDPFVLSMNEYLNFESMSAADTIPSKRLENGRRVREALEILGNAAETKNQLIEQYAEITGLSTKTTLHRHINEAVDDQFIGMEYYTKDGSNKRLARYFLP